MSTIRTTRSLLVHEDIQFGRVLVVDGVNGDDRFATPGELAVPYATVASALASAVSGDLVFVLPGVYDLSAGLTMPANVTLKGFTSISVILRMLNVTADTVLLTLPGQCRVEDVTLQLTSALHVNLTGILWTGTSSEFTKMRRVGLLVDNSTAGPGTSNIYGCRINCTSTPARDIRAITECNVRVTSADAGVKRGILIDTSLSNITVNDLTILVQRASGAGANYIGAEVNFAGGRLDYDNGYISGDNGDISETLGTLELGAVQIEHSNANGLGFHNIRYSLPFVWGDPGGLVGGATRFMRPGSATAAIPEIKHRLARAACCKTLHIRAQVAPGATRTDTWTIRRNGVDTALVGSLTGAETFKIISNISVSFAEGDDISCKLVTAAATGTTDVIVGVELF